MSDQSKNDVDTPIVLGILIGAVDNTGDPDVGLARRLVELVDAPTTKLDVVLKDLIRDAF